VFGPKILILKAEEPMVSVEVRAIPQVVIEGQFFDSKGKPQIDHEPDLRGRIDDKNLGDRGNIYLTEGTIDKNGFVIRAPKGLKEAKLSLMTNEHGALRVRLSKDGPLSNQSRDIDLGTLDHDVRGIEVICYVAPILLIKPVAEDGGLLREAKLKFEYAKGRGPWEGQGRYVDGADVSYEKQDDGRKRTNQLLPDEEFTVTVEAEGYEPKSEKLKLPEGAVKELEVQLKKQQTAAQQIEKPRLIEIEDRLKDRLRVPAEHSLQLAIATYEYLQTIHKSETFVDYTVSIQDSEISIKTAKKKVGKSKRNNTLPKS